MGARVLTEEQITAAAKATGAASYTFGGGTFIGGLMGFLNEYALAVGAICAVITMIANIIFRELERRDRVRTWQDIDRKADKQ